MMNPFEDPILEEEPVSQVIPTFIHPDMINKPVIFSVDNYSKLVATKSYSPMAVLPENESKIPTIGIKDLKFFHVIKEKQTLMAALKTSIEFEDEEDYDRLHIFLVEKNVFSLVELLLLHSVNRPDVLIIEAQNEKIDIDSIRIVYPDEFLEFVNVRVFVENKIHEFYVNKLKNPKFKFSADIVETLNKCLKYFEDYYPYKFYLNLSDALLAFYKQTILTLIA